MTDSDWIQVSNKPCAENLLASYADQDMREILACSCGHEINGYDLRKKVQIPTTSFYRKLSMLKKFGFIVEGRKISTTANRRFMTSTYLSIYRSVRFDISLNRVSAFVKISSGAKT